MLSEPIKAKNLKGYFIQGRIKTHTLKVKNMATGELTEYPGEWFDFVDMIGEDIFVVDQWYKPGTPQVIHRAMVEEVINY